MLLSKYRYCLDFFYRDRLRDRLKMDGYCHAGLWTPRRGLDYNSLSRHDCAYGTTTNCGPSLVPPCHSSLVEKLLFPEGAHPLFCMIARFSHWLVKLVTLRRHSTERGEFVPSVSEHIFSWRPVQSVSESFLSAVSLSDLLLSITQYFILKTSWCTLLKKNFIASVVRPR